MGKKKDIQRKKEQNIKQKERERDTSIPTPSPRFTQGYPAVTWCLSKTASIRAHAMSNDVVLQSKDFVACLWAIGDHNGCYGGLF